MSDEPQLAAQDAEWRQVQENTSPVPLSDGDRLCAQPRLPVSRWTRWRERLLWAGVLGLLPVGCVIAWFVR